MDSDRFEATPVKGIRATRQARRQLRQPSRLPGSAAGVDEHAIRGCLAQAEQLIRQQCPAAALALLQAGGLPPAAWPRSWRPRWSALVGWALIEHHQPEAASGVLQQGLELFDELQSMPEGDERVPQELGEWLRYFLGVSYCRSDQPVQALHCHSQGLAAIVAGAIRDPELTMLHYQGLGQAYLALGDEAKAIACLTLARQRGQDVYDPYAEGVIDWSLGQAYTQQGDLLQARRALIQALRRFNQLDAQPLVAQVRALLGQVLLGQQHLAEAEAMLRQALGAAERLGDSQTRGVALERLARVYLACGKPVSAIRMVQTGLSRLQETQGQPTSGQLYLTLAEVYEVQHNHSAAEKALKTALRLLQQTHQEGLIFRAHERYGQFLAGQGRFAEAYVQMQDALLHKARWNDL
ncbi:MAG TPA: tetratricopeptide repeat protein [Ktedonobacterales bacterium]